jgi:hypothetical protein
MITIQNILKYRFLEYIKYIETNDNVVVCSDGNKLIKKIELYNYGDYLIDYTQFNYCIDYLIKHKHIQDFDNTNDMVPVDIYFVLVYFTDFTGEGVL